MQDSAEKGLTLTVVLEEEDEILAQELEDLELLMIFGVVSSHVSLHDPNIQRNVALAIVVECTARRIMDLSCDFWQDIIRGRLALIQTSYHKQRSILESDSVFNGLIQRMSYVLLCNGRHHKYVKIRFHGSGKIVFILVVMI